MEPSVEKSSSLKGPVVILGAGGFIGSNLFQMLSSTQEDVYGLVSPRPSWRLSGVSEKKLVRMDFNSREDVATLMEALRPGTVINCLCYGAYPFQQDLPKILHTNFVTSAYLLEHIHHKAPDTCLIHLGSSSEYGDHSKAPKESEKPQPNSLYSVAKYSTSQLIEYYGKKLGVCCVNLRLYSVYGPFEEPSRLIPRLILKGLENQYPPLTDPEISRDFVHVEDVFEAVKKAAIQLKEQDYGESFNIGTGVKTTVRDLANWTKNTFQLEEEPVFDKYPPRTWDQKEWFSDPSKTVDRLDWKAKIYLEKGLQKTLEWYRTFSDKTQRFFKPQESDTTKKIAVIVACYNDGLAIKDLYIRLTKTLRPLPIRYQIIFVNDGSQDGTEELIRKITQRDDCVIGISHSRNFGSQAVFRSGMQLADADACILMDGDLQDPPELIPEFISRWNEGDDVVYGVRKTREEFFLRTWSRKLFYRLFKWSSSLPVALDSGDFGLLDRKAVRALLECKENDVFWRGLRALIGFTQSGVSYHRPKRTYGRSTNSWGADFNWAKKAFLSFGDKISNVYFWGCLFLLLGGFVYLIQDLIRGKGFSGWLVLGLIFCVIQVLGLMLVNDRLNRVLNETKARPSFIRHKLIFGGAVKNWKESCKNFFRL